MLQSVADGALDTFLVFEVEKMPQFVAVANMALVPAQRRLGLAAQPGFGKHCPVSLVQALQIDRTVAAAERAAAHNGGVAAAFNDL